MRFIKKIFLCYSVIFSSVAFSEEIGTPTGVTGIILIPAIILIICVFAWIDTVTKNAQRKTRWQNALNLSDFSHSMTLSDTKFGLAVDTESRRIRLFTDDGQSVKYRTFLAKDILSCEILEDGDSTIAVNRGSQVAGAAVGGLLLGGAGLIVGGLSGKKKTSKIVSKVDFRVTVNDIKQPIHTVNLLSTDGKSQSPLYKGVLETCHKWSATIDVLIHASRQDEKEALNKVSSDMNGGKRGVISVADEIKKLAALRDDGVLTNEEFQAEKARMLSS